MPPLIPNSKPQLYRRKPTIAEAYQCGYGQTVNNVEALAGDYVVLADGGKRFVIPQQIFEELYDLVTEDQQYDV